MNKAEKKFYEVFTDLQCFILANMNRSDINGVTATHYNIIEYIYRNDKCIVKEIAKAFNISPPAISKQLKFLIEHNFIKQQQSSLDRRIFNLSVTDKGKFIIDNSENFRETVAKKASKTLTKDDLKNLTELLNKVLAEIKD
ncbi:MarR family transcriptional regulator [Elizabethkingia sp. HX XZB]|uniref:MarR family winged helix-turn-helix transcriptional regulator n=1 Tax=Flavobacteriales TaxID=200644 RepID=UPI0008413234|nr:MULTISPECIES: MarR family transcriptional regulator [Elizabethkingia]MDX8569976.1 MarR family transcriptional regulator [Elizabethkingia sp. HX XZB]ODM55265.1 MarR family transcriptional regulator [Elizabethkingia meningoseptica]OHT30471.1 MarR family transcriptional regulator [Elizabethkingia meningoseptica]OPC15502.1 MarR family transcriptional regulator [Elizabethkingia meningoseptica]OPC41355.1 MarR family transcriptional regulator [Elizabethkingia anophelis]